MRKVWDAPGPTEGREPASVLGGTKQREPSISTSAVATLTVADTITLYLDYVALRHQLGAYSDAAKLRITRYLESFAKRFGDCAVAECRSEQLTRWLLENPSWKSPSTKSDALTSVLVAFKWAARERHIPFSPYLRPHGLAIHPRPRPAITLEEYRQFMHGARNRIGRRKRPSATALRCAVYFLWRTGARTCEMRSVLFRDLDRSAGVIRLEHHKTELVTGEDRLIGLDARVLRLINRLERTRRANGQPCDCGRPDAHQKGEHIFPNGRAGPWTKDTFARLFRTFANLAGIGKKKTAYCLRHGFCVSAIKAGLSDREIADQLGQTGTKYVNWYGRTSRQHADHLCEVARRANGKQ